jgi:hypothetical protein
MTRKTEMAEQLARAFWIALQLTGSVEGPEAAVTDGIAALEPGIFQATAYWCQPQSPRFGYAVRLAKPLNIPSNPRGAALYELPRLESGEIEDRSIVHAAWEARMEFL